MLLFSAITALSRLWQRKNRPGASLLATLLVSLPPSLLFRLYYLAGLLNYYTNHQEREAALAALAETFPNCFSIEELQHLCCRHFVIRTAKYLNFLMFPKLSPGWQDTFLRAQGFEFVHESVARGRGVLLCSLHTGDGNLFVPLVCRYHKGSHFIRLGRLDTVQSQLSGQALAPHRQDRAAYRVLQHREILGMAIDGIVGKKLVPVSFLGQRLYVTPMPARLAKKTGCAVVPLLSLFHWDQYFEMIFLPSLFYEGDLDHPEFVPRFMQKIFTSLEPFVLRDPAQWHCWPFLKILKLPATERPTEFIHRTEM